MKFNPQKHHRQSIRLKGYDYSNEGAYFVTIVAWQRGLLFGEIVNEMMILNKLGEIVADKWQWLETQYDYVELGAWIVMPNHFHGVLIIRRGDSRIAPTQKIKPLGRLIGVFKTVSTKHINLLRNTEGQIVWQRNYYEHIIRNEREWDNIHRYIESNPSMWVEDEENPNRVNP